MKDMAKVLNRMSIDFKKVGIEKAEEIKDINEGLQILGCEIVTKGSTSLRNLFKKYGKYSPNYVQEHLPMFYPLIKDEVEKMEIKSRVKAGMSEAEAREEAERTKKLESLDRARIIGYARVSTKEQNLGRQLKALEGAGCDVIFQEKKTGKNVDRIQYKLMMETVKSGDTIIISELTRLARSTADLFAIVKELEEKGVAIKSLKEAWLDTTTATGRLLFTFMAGISQFERELMLERQSEGIKVAKENGVKFGKKLKENADLDLAIALYKEGKYTTTQIATMTNISRTTLWRNLKKLGLLE